MLERWAVMQDAKGNKPGAAIARTLIEQYGDETLELAFDDNSLRAVPPRTIIEEVSSYFGISPESLSSKTVKREISYPRQLAMFLMNSTGVYTLEAIGGPFNRDHSTVAHSLKRTEGMLQVDPQVQRDQALIKARISARVLGQSEGSVQEPNNQGRDLSSVDSSEVNNLSGFGEISIDQIIATVCDSFGIDRDLLMARDKRKLVSHPRNIAIYLVNKVANLTLVDTGKVFNRDHATIRTAIVRIKRLSREEDSVRDEIGDICRTLRNSSV